MGAPHFLGNPVVSVSNIKYIVSEKQKLKLPILNSYYLKILILWTIKNI
jgi:hypothetical protein